MKRTMIVTAAALFLAGAAYPILALDGKKTTEPVKAIEKKDESKVLEVKPSEPMAKDTTATPPAVTEKKEVKPSEPMAKDASTTTPAVTETKPAAPTPTTSTAAPAMTDKVKDVVKDKVMDTAKDKALDAATGGMKTPSVPGVK